MTELASHLDTIKEISFVFIYLVLNSQLGTKNPVLSYSISPAACESRWTYYVFQVAQSGEKRMVLRSGQKFEQWISVSRAAYTSNTNELVQQ